MTVAVIFCMRKLENLEPSTYKCQVFSVEAQVSTVITALNVVFQVL